MGNERSLVQSMYKVKTTKRTGAASFSHRNAFLRESACTHILFARTSVLRSIVRVYLCVCMCARGFVCFLVPSVRVPLSECVFSMLMSAGTRSFVRASFCGSHVFSLRMVSHCHRSFRNRPCRYVCAGVKGQAEVLAFHSHRQ